MDCFEVEHISSDIENWFFHTSVEYQIITQLCVDNFALSLLFIWFRVPTMTFVIPELLYTFNEMLLKNDKFLIQNFIYLKIYQLQLTIKKMEYSGCRLWLKKTITNKICAKFVKSYNVNIFKCKQFRCYKICDEVFLWFLLKLKKINY